MLGTYPILLDKKPIGVATVDIQGLYYKISCFCTNTFRPHCRIAILLSSGKIDLGLCVPTDNGYGLHTRVPIKSIRGQNPEFVLVKPNQKHVLFIPIDERQPFNYLTKLKMARFAVRDGKTGVELTVD